MSRLDLVVGPNGAGKSTFIEFVLAPSRPKTVIVNADEIAKQMWPADPMGHSYDAAQRADATRRELIDRGMPFIAETVFSHPSKLELIDLAIDAGYEVALQVVMVPIELSVQRVPRRVAAGGHDVPEDKIRGRYERLWDVVVAAVDRVDTATFWDNSTLDGPEIVAVFSAGFCIGSPAWPSWTPTALRHQWPSTGWAEDLIERDGGDASEN